MAAPSVPRFRGTAFRVGADAAHAVNARIAAGDHAWLLRLALLLDTPATRDAVDDARAVAAARDTDPDPDGGPPEAAE